jgi:hypothetical protein
MPGVEGLSGWNLTKNLDKVKRKKNSPLNTICVLFINVFGNIATINVEIK